MALRVHLCYGGQDRCSALVLARWRGSGPDEVFRVPAVFLMALLGRFYPYNRGELMVALVLLYAFTSGIAGYVSGRWYARLGGGTLGASSEDWPTTVVLSASILNGPIVGTFMYLNTTALIYRSTKVSAGFTSPPCPGCCERLSRPRRLLSADCVPHRPYLHKSLSMSFFWAATRPASAPPLSSTQALTFLTTVKMVALWLLVTLPLLVVGIIKGKNSGAHFDAPSRTNRVARRIPAKPWYLYPVVQVAMSGALPFSAIYIELYYIFASVWGHKMYTIYSILLIVFGILLVVTAFICGESLPRSLATHAPELCTSQPCPVVPRAKSPCCLPSPSPSPFPSVGLPIVPPCCCECRPRSSSRSGADVLPAGCGGPQVVVAELPEWGFHRAVHHGVRRLLLDAVPDARLAAVQLLLWLHILGEEDHVWTDHPFLWRAGVKSRDVD